jgi:hypothetical protein
MNVTKYNEESTIDYITILIPVSFWIMIIFEVFFRS